MKDALEMAVLTTVSHPNIIQVYNCFTDMVEDAGEGRGVARKGEGLPLWESGLGPGRGEEQEGVESWDGLCAAGMRR